MGFEPSVPGTKEPVFVAEGELRDRTGAAKRVFLMRYRWFESISLQRGVCVRTWLSGPFAKLRARERAVRTEETSEYLFDLAMDADGDSFTLVSTP